MGKIIEKDYYPLYRKKYNEPFKPTQLQKSMELKQTGVQTIWN